jgi:hypothetical protein
MSKSEGDGPVAMGVHQVFRKKSSKSEGRSAGELPYGGDQFDNTDFRLGRALKFRANM